MSYWSQKLEVEAIYQAEQKLITDVLDLTPDQKENILTSLIEQAKQQTFVLEDHLKAVKIFLSMLINDMSFELSLDMKLKLSQQGMVCDNILRTIKSNRL